MKYITIPIDVTQNDIDRGKRGSGTMCPIAIATRRTLRKLEFPKSWIVFVNSYSGVVESSGSILMGRINNISGFAYKFDKRLPVKPRQFLLKLYLPTRR
jgi:hypothetical protein